MNVSLHLEVLDPSARAALERHARAADGEGFYLAGGTGLALQLGHRRSVDFDWFRQDGFEALGLARRLVELGVPFVSGSTARGTLHGRVQDTRVSFLEFRYPLLDPTVDGGMGFRLAGPRDIGTMKLAAVAQRGARKDFYDLVALARAGFPLGALLAAYQERFRVEDPGHVLTALTYFDDAERDTELILGAHADWASVKDAIRGWVREFARA
jgi:hypothetical protein